jgi:hypothetical protein
VIADDTVSAFLVNVEVPKLGSEQVDLVVAKASAEAVTLLAILFRASRCYCAGTSVASAPAAYW